MEKELPAKESIKEVVAPYGPREIEMKVVEKLGADRVELNRAVKEKVNPLEKPLKLVSLASGDDIANPLVATGATYLVFVDMTKQVNAITDEIGRIGGEVKSEKTYRNRTEIEFEWNGRSRKLLYYELNVNKDMLDKLPEEIGDCDVCFMKKAHGISGSEVKGRVIDSIKIGGFYISDSGVGEAYGTETAGIGEALGFEDVQLDEKFKGSKYRFGHGHARLHHKIKGAPTAAVLHFNDVLHTAISRRHGGIFGIGEADSETALSNYRETLKEFKGIFDYVPEETRNKLKPVVIETLFKAPGDMSMVHESPENYMKQLEFLRRTAVRSLPPEEVEDFEKKISEAESKRRDLVEKYGTDYPVKQLEKFIEEGRKIFREVFPDGVS